MRNSIAKPAIETRETLMQAGFGGKQAAHLRIGLIELEWVAQDIGHAQAGGKTQSGAGGHVPLAAAVAGKDGIAFAMCEQGEPVGDTANAGCCGSSGQRRNVVVVLLAAANEDAQD